MTIQAHAKVNLTLRILDKRADGFHNLETLMVPVTLCDDVDVVVTDGEGITLECDNPDVPADGRNLAWRAVEAFVARTGRRFHVRISLKKRIPFGAGLGGGSSDAASVLVALDRILGTELPAEDLEAVAATLGSDIPFFIRSRPAICRGRGEILTRFDGGIPECGILLVKPPFPVPTAWAYQAWAASDKKPTASSGELPGGITLVNDLERPVFAKYLMLPALKEWLAAQPEVAAAMMSGSGSTVFAVLRDGPGSLEDRLRNHFGETLWTHSCRLGWTV